MKQMLLATLCGFFWQTLAAQDLFIVNARIIDGLGETIDGGGLRITDGRIASMGLDMPEPADDITIDASGMTVMPGMINAHWHLLAGSAASTDEEIYQFVEAAVVGALDRILERGITTIMSTGDHMPDILEVREKLNRGELRGPRLIAVGPVFTSPADWPTQICAGNVGCNDRMNAVVSNAEQARAKVRDLAAAGVDALKLVYDDIIAPDVRIADEVVAALADEAHKHDLRLFAHLSSTSVPASTLLDLGVDGFVHSEMNLTGALDEMRARQIPVVTTSAAALTLAERPRVSETEFEATAEFYLEQSLTNIWTLWQAGVPVAFGTDAIVGPPGLSSGFQAMTASGEGLFVAELRALSRELSNEQIIASLTRNAAFALGLDDQIGTLEPGNIADIVMIDGDPLADITDLEKVRMVIQGGRIVVDRR